MFTTMTVLVAALAAAVLLGSVMPIDAENVMDSSPEAQVARFRLENRCAPITLLVEDVDRDEVAMGLTQEIILTTVRSRLRAARLYTRESEPYLYVNVQTSKPAFSILFAFKKVLFDPISGLETSATTWQEGFVGRGDAAYILSGLSRLTDTFIDEYLRVNAPACPRGPLDP